MREIKFKAWDVEKAKMIVVDQMTFRTNGDVFNVWDSKISDDVPGLLINPSSGILMQYTCLKDKNGVEIYEGDIIKGNIACVDFKGYVIELVKWDNTKLGFSFSGAFLFNHKLLPGKNNGYDIKVVGNIYENPELLEAIT